MSFPGVFPIETWPQAGWGGLFARPSFMVQSHTKRQMATKLNHVIVFTWIQLVTNTIWLPYGIQMELQGELNTREVFYHDIWELN